MKNYKQFIIENYVDDYLDDHLGNYDEMMNDPLTEHQKKMEQYNPMIDYTLLNNDIPDDDIVELCEKAKKFEVKSVCVMPKYVRVAAKELKDSDVLVCTVISFPEGTNSLEQKEKETHQVITDGADEVDMVLDYQKLLANWDEEKYPTEMEHGLPIQIEDELGTEVSALVDICHSAKNKENESVILKVIVESGNLTVEQTVFTTEICITAGVDFIKTSTGKVTIGAELDKIESMYNTIQDKDSDMKIKASGGVRDMNDLTTFGQYVDRFGMGFGSVDTLNGLESDSEGY